MERYPGARRLSRGVVTLLWISAAGWLQLPAVCFAGRPLADTVRINNDMILLHPGTRLRKPDRQAFDQILSQYDKSLYKIQYYKKGRPFTRTYGQLSDALIDKTIAAEAESAKLAGESIATLQIIAATRSEQPFATAAGAQQPPSPAPGATTNPQQARPQASPGATTNPQHAAGASPAATTNPQRQNAPAVGDKAARELIERLKPILKRYSKK
jgi:hypothetical protein